MKEPSVKVSSEIPGSKTARTLLNIAPFRPCLWRYPHLSSIILMMTFVFCTFGDVAFAKSDVKLASEGKVLGGPFEYLQQQIDEIELTPGPPGLKGEKGEPGPPGADGKDGASCTVANNSDGTKTITCSDGTSVQVRDDQQLQANFSALTSAHLDSLDYVANCLEMKSLALGTFMQLSDALENWPSNINVQLFEWVQYYLDEEVGEIVANEQTAMLNAEELENVMAEVESLAECTRNGAQRMNEPFPNTGVGERQFYEALSRTLRTHGELYFNILESNR